MARQPYVFEEVEVPENVEVRVEGSRVVVKGPLGSLERDFGNLPIIIRSLGKSIIIESYFAGRREKAVVGVVAGQIKNLIIGVTRGWRYKLKIVFSHFPMSVKVQGNQLVIENFMGRRSKITLEIPKGLKVSTTKDDIIVEGIDRELVSQFAARVEEATTLRGDERISPHGREGGPGVLDGIYVYAAEYMK
ncbi:MAG: 50S ribosomal protein L6 [Vulcanisaeta sp. AZ3]|jgi:large subunit ribosomal protein L6|nr:MAG: 50S ribosomal protein L6 [Vulcanisaeta sp. AZ3]